jgi:hypothetical protein
MADIQVNLLHGDRELQSRYRQRCGRKFSAKNTLKIVEVPPGPPVLSTLVAEVYGGTKKSGETKKRFTKQMVL